jgi:hypothetical protein
VIFLLGVAIMLDGIVGTEPSLRVLLVGLVLLGLLPLDVMAEAYVRRYRK